MPRLIREVVYEGGSREEIVYSTLSAVRDGHRGLDIAGQPGNYYKAGIDKALEGVFASGVERGSLFIQAAINPEQAVDLRPGDSISRQVDLLIRHSIVNLGLSYLDSLVLHSTFPGHEQTMEAWRAMEAAVKTGLVRQLGIWNLVGLNQMRQIYADAAVKPAVVQQMIFGEVTHDLELRAWCADVGIYLQSFWTLTVDKHAIASNVIDDLARKYSVRTDMLYFRFVLGMQVVPLISVGDEHVGEYLEAQRIPLTLQDSETIFSRLVPNGKEEDMQPMEMFAAHVAAMKECSRHGRRDLAMALLWRRHSLAKQPSSPESPKLVAAIPTHVNSESRLQRLQESLGGIAGQVGYKPVAVFASVSASTPELLRRARKVFLEFEQQVEGDDIQVHVFFRSSARSQFMHYASLVEPLKRFARNLKYGNDGEDDEVEDDAEAIASIWLLFTDDDDLWYPYRTLIFSQAINKTVKLHGITPINIPLFVHNTPNTGSATFTGTPDDVDHLLKTGGAAVQKYNEKQARERPFLEYWLHAVPLRVFLDFMLVTPPDALEHKLCDIRFATFIRDHACLPAMLSIPTAHIEKPHIYWMTFYRQHEDEGQLTQVYKKKRFIDPDDLERTKLIKGRLQHNYVGHWAESDEEDRVEEQKNVDPVDKVCADLRREMTMMLMYGSIPMPDIVNGCLQRVRLKGTPDEALWAQLTESLAAVLLVTMAPPGRVNWFDHGTTLAYQMLEEDLELESLVATAAQRIGQRIDKIALGDNRQVDHETKLKRTMASMQDNLPQEGQQQQEQQHQQLEKEREQYQERQQHIEKSEPPKEAPCSLEIEVERLRYKYLPEPDL